jgi:hypothetical protein
MWYKNKVSRRIYSIIFIILIITIILVSKDDIGLKIPRIFDLFLIIIPFFLYEILGEKFIKELNKELDDVKSDQKKEIERIKSSFPIFKSDFYEFCTESQKAISNAHDDSDILTIQTPLDPDEDSPDFSYYKSYVNHTVDTILEKNEVDDKSKIPKYMRLIVINDITDNKEIISEKKKIKIFIEEIYNKLSNWNRSWKPNLKNIYIGIVEAKNIHKSPFSHLDILLIKGTHLVIAFPTEEEKRYRLGPSIHFSDNEWMNKFNNQIQEFSKLYKKVWQNKDVKKINFGVYHEPENLGISKDKIINEIDNIFNSLTCIKQNEISSN